MAKRTPTARDTKERILDAALDVFGERGFRAASVDEIAARAGVTKGAVYHWFKDKDDLARDLHDTLYGRLKIEALKAMDPGRNALTNLRYAFDAYLAALENLGSARFFLRDSYVITELDDSARGQLDESTMLLRAVIEDGKRRGDIAKVDAEATARVLVGAFSGATLHILQTGEAGPTQRVIDRILDSLAPRPTDHPPKVATTRARPRAQRG